MSISLDHVPLVGVLALLPVLVFAVARGDPFAAVATLNVALIVGSVGVLLGWRTDSRPGGAAGHGQP